MKKRCLLFLLVSIFFVLSISFPSNAASYDANVVVRIAQENANKGTTGWSGYCLAFVRQCFDEAYGFSSSSCCAYNYGNSYIDSTSRDNIPLGADVFFGGSDVVCNCGNRAGHIGIYVGDGNIVHSWGSKIQKTSIQHVINCGYPYRGWGWHGNIELDDITQHTISFHNTPAGTTTTKSVEDGKPLGTLPTPEVAGMKFEGWYTKAFGQGIKVTSSTVLGEDTNLYAHYSYEGTRLTFDANGGSLPGAVAEATADGVNLPRYENTLRIYNKAGAPVDTNIHGNEVVVAYNGKVVETRPYGTETQLIVPEGGFVLSGHGTNHDFVGDILPQSLLKTMAITSNPVSGLIIRMNPSMVSMI